MEEIIGVLNGIVWSNALIVLCLGTGLYFSIRTRFLQVRHIREMFRLLFDGKSSESGVSSFQALAMSLAGRVGTGISQGSHGYCFGVLELCFGCGWLHSLELAQHL
jgi:AGCS family alanine or glycine:cation symporter